MPDYIYLLENRLSADQQNALHHLREAVREAEMILFLTGDAVRDLTSGHSVRDLEVSVHGDALKLKKIIEKLGGKVWGEDEVSRTLYLCFPGTVRVDVVSTHRNEYPKPGTAVRHPASIQEDLRRRDFTVNAMAISLNEGSFGLLMDPLNGAADIESRTLRLVSNYGFLEEPSLLIRATRYIARLGWELDPKTQSRYENAKGEGVIEYLSPMARSQELEQIGHEEEGLKVLRALEAEGWMKALFPAWTAAKADEEKLKALHDLAVELLLEGVHADMSAAQMQLLTARLAPKDLAALKKLMLRPGFVEEWDSLDAQAAGFAKVLLSKENAVPSASFKLFTKYDPEAVLWLGFASKDFAVKERFKQFLKIWPEARQRIPHALMQEMRITPELPAYNEVVRAIFLELIDGRLTTPEEIRALLEPHSPPAPPPQVSIKRPRAKRGADAKMKETSYDDDEESEEDLDEDEDLDDIGGDEEVVDMGLSVPKADLEFGVADEPESADDDLESEEAESAPVSVKHSPKGSAEPKLGKKIPPAQVTAATAKTEKAQPAPKSKAAAKPETKSAVAAKPSVPVAKAQAPAAKAKPVPGPGKANPSANPIGKKAAPVAVVSKNGKSVALANVRVKAPAKTPVKAAPVKPVPAKGKSAPVGNSKAGKAAPPARSSKPVEKKGTAKAGKKHH